MSPSTAGVRCCTTCGAVYRAEYPRCLNDGMELVTMSRDPLLGANVGPYVVDALLGEVGMGLAHAHDLGLIHRDFKPDNIIVVNDPAGEVPRIADFGLAITNDSHDVRLTTSGMVLGTPAYVAPEQVTGSEVDHRADLY